MRRALEADYHMDYDQIERMGTTEMRALIEKRTGMPYQLAVPFYDSKLGRWISDPKHFCDPEEDFRRAMRPAWYERVLDFFRR